MKFIIVVCASVSVMALTGCELLQVLSLVQGTGACPGEEESKGTMTAEIDGEAFDACITVGSGDGGALTVTGQEYGNGLVPTQLQVSVVSAAVGTFALGTADASGRYTADVETTYATVPEVAGGTVEIVTFDDTGAAGTFSFEAVNGNDGDSQVSITAGAFDVTFE